MAAVDDEPDAPVLRQALLGDVQLGHDLHARDDAGGHLARHGGDVLQDAVDAEADPHLVAVRREVDVGGARSTAWPTIWLTSLMTGASSARLVEVDDLAAVLLSSSGSTCAASPTTSSRRSRREISVAMSSGGATATRTS